jgi:hypothetical protein
MFFFVFFFSFFFIIIIIIIDFAVLGFSLTSLPYCKSCVLCLDLVLLQYVTSLLFHV